MFKKMALIVAALSLYVNPALAQKDTLTIGVNMTEARTLDPARNADYMPPLVIGNVYETLITLEPGRYDTPVPGLAERWEKRDNTYRFYLRPNVVFSNGKPLTAEDVKFSFDRLIALKDQPAEYASNIADTRVVNSLTVDVVLKNANEPMLIKMVAPAFSIYSKDVASKDDVTRELNQTSYGTAAYKLVRWEPNNQIVLERNELWRNGKANYRRVIIRHIPDSNVQVLALRRGDIDIAMNLTADQLLQVRNVAETNSIDMIYMTLTSNAQLNPQLAKKEVRQAIANAIDYNGMIRGLLGGYAIRPPSFIPVGIQGVTESDVMSIGYNTNIDRSIELLNKAGERNVTFDLAYVPTNIVGTNYELVAQKIKSDLAKIGVRVNLIPMEAAALRTAFRAGQLQAVITFWDPDGPEADLLASAVVGRVSGRIGWDSTPLKDLVARAASEQNVAKRAALYREFSIALVDQSNLIVLMQPKYRLGISNSVTNVQLNAAGWRMELERIQAR